MVDAGPSMVDAGPSMVDAGPSMVDAGPSTVDAGPSTVDAGGPVPCDPTFPCGSGLSCCANFCTDTAHDPRNCGACGVACTASQFCTGTACDNAIFSNVCANARATVALGPYSQDNAAGVTLGGALATGCNPAVSVVQASQESGILAGDAGQPNTGVGNTLVVGGGSFGQLAVRYLDQAGLSPLYLKTDGVTAQYILRSTGTPAFAAVMVSALTAHHDYFIVELAVEPQSGTLCFVGAGILAPGTGAAAYYGSTELIPKGASGMHSANSWVAVEWTDAPGDGGAPGEGGVDMGDGIPNAGDTFRVVASGP
jgi:hypothetical protein